MKLVRVLAGLLCIAVSFGLVVLLGLGVFDPTQGAAAGANGSLTPVLVALMPSVAVGLSVFALGVWLLSTTRASTGRGSTGRNSTGRNAAGRDSADRASTDRSSTDHDSTGTKP